MRVGREMRIFAVLVAGSLALSTTGCAEAPEDDDDAGVPTGEEYQACMVTDTGGIDDRSFNASAWAGLEAAAAEESSISAQYVASAAEADYVPNLEGFVAQDCDFILAVGGLMFDQTQQVAQANPERQFGIVDANVGEPNVYPMEFDTAQAAFLAGYLAAGFSESEVVATYGGLNIPPVTIFMDGFVDGVEHYNDVKDADVTVLGWDKDAQEGSFADSFTDQAAGRALSDAFVAQGADVVMPVAGGAGLGTADGALATDDYAVIWVDVDGCQSAEQYCPAFLTTVVKNIPLAVQDAVLAAFESDGLAAGEYLGTLENDGVSLAPYHEYQDQIPEELQAEVDQLRQDIIDGTIGVTSPAQPR